MPSFDHISNWRERADNARQRYETSFAAERVRMNQEEVATRQAQQQRKKLLERLREQPIIVYPDN